MTLTPQDSGPRSFEGARQLFRLPAEAHYLNCAYMSPLAQSVEDAVIAGLRLKRNPSQVGPDDFFEPADGVRQRFARLIGVPEQSERVAILPAVSYGVALAARNLAVGRGREVVVLGEQFPSNVYAWVRRAREDGGRLVRVERPDSGSAVRWSDALLEAIGATTAIVAVPPVHWTDGTAIDLVAVGERCRDVGAALVIDGTQSIGAVPFDAAAVQPDAIVTAAYKWLMGPYGIALGWFGERFDDGVPLEEGWISRAGSRNFGGLVDYPDAYAPGAQRYDMGERSNFALLPGVAAGLDLVIGWTPERISEQITRLSEPLFEQVSALGFRTGHAAERAPHMFGLQVPEGFDPERLTQSLAARNVSVSKRGSSVRVSPHVYNEAVDLEALVEALSDALKQ